MQPPRPSEALIALYELYVKFVKRLSEERKWHSRASGNYYDLDEFQQWWTSLEPKQQEAYQKEFEIGYEKVLEKAKERVLSVVHKYRGAK
jgi:hypothetical protein